MMAIKNGQSGETDNIGYTRHKTKTKKTQYVLDTTMHTQDTRGRQIKQKTQHNFVEHHYKLIIKRK
jgi:hypothetical protein